MVLLGLETKSAALFPRFMDRVIVTVFQTLLDINFFACPQGKKELVAVDSTEFDDENGDLGDSENEETREESQGSLQSDLDSDEERQR